MRCDLHVHSRYSTDSGNYALRRARLPESFTDPERVYRVSRRRGMDLVTITDHNTLEGALRIAHLPSTFLSVEVTTRFPEDDVPLHVLVWDLSEEDHRDLQPCRRSVYELVAFLRARGLTHALAHPLYRMGAPLTPAHVERLLLLFEVWEGRNGARPQDSNELACRLAGAASPAYLEKLAERHGLEPRHRGIALTGGSDDHGGIDLATTWTEAGAADLEGFLAAVHAGACSPGGEHGSTLKLAHAVAGLLLRAYRDGGGALPEPLGGELEALFRSEEDDVAAQHGRIAAASSRLARVLGAEARAGGLDAPPVTGLGRRLGSMLLAATVQLPYLATAHHHTASRRGVRELESSFFGLPDRLDDPRALVFTDTFTDTNGVAGTMRVLAAAAAAGTVPLRVVAAGEDVAAPGVLLLEPDWSTGIPGYESLELRFPSPTAVLSLVEREAPDVVHVATPGPVGACGLLAAELLGIPVVGSWHTELGAYALHLTGDLLVAEAFERYVEWFYRQCTSLLAPTAAVASALEARGFGGRVRVWGRGVDSELFTPARRRPELRAELLRGGDLLLLSVGRVSSEKRLEVLLEAFARLRAEVPGARLAVVGDGPARPGLEEAAPEGVRFLGERRGAELAALYASADLFAFTSTSDTFGQVLLEAAASGLPVVAAAAGGAAELVREGETGLLVPPDDSVALARALARLAGSPEQRARLGAGGREAALERTWERSCAELRDAYREAAGAPGPARAPIAA